MNGRPQILERKGEKWGAHGSGQEFLEIALGSGASQEVNRRLRVIDGFEKGKPENMVHMGMGENDIVFKPFLLKQGIPQTSDSRPGIHNNNTIVLTPYLKAGGIPTVFEIGAARDRDRTPRAVASHNHAVISPCYRETTVSEYLR
jgi:hypothetical protein